MSFGFFSNCLGIDDEKNVYLKIKALIEKVESLLEEYISYNKYNRDISAIKVNNITETIGTLELKIDELNKKKNDLNLLQTLYIVLKKAEELAKVNTLNKSFHNNDDMLLHKIYIELTNIQRLVTSNVTLPAVSQFIINSNISTNELFNNISIFNWENIVLLKDSIFIRENYIHSMEIKNLRNR